MDGTRPKRVLTEQQLAQLAVARERALAARRQKAAERQAQPPEAAPEKRADPVPAPEAAPEKRRAPQKRVKPPPSSSSSSSESSTEEEEESSEDEEPALLERKYRTKYQQRYHAKFQEQRRLVELRERLRSKARIAAARELPAPLRRMAEETVAGATSRALAPHADTRSAHALHDAHRQHLYQSMFPQY